MRFVSHSQRHSGVWFQRNVWYSVGIAVLLFFGLQLGYLYRDYLLLDEHKLDLESEIRSKEALIQRQRTDIRFRERDIFRLERQLRILESKLRINPLQSLDLTKTNENTIYIITATYARPAQKADLTRLSYTLSLVPNICWILVEDNDRGPSDLVKNIVLRSKIRHALLHAPTPSDFRPIPDKPRWIRPRGVAQRNEGLEWLRINIDKNANGVVYFADDDNTYDIRLFSEMRNTQKVSVWPVAFVGQLMVERPKIEDNKVIGWNVKWRPERPYATDMAGFAINLRLLLQRKNVRFYFNSSVGYQETRLISQLIDGLHELEPKADYCSQVYVWHTKTEKPSLLSEDKYVKSDMGIEV